MHVIRTCFVLAAVIGLATASLWLAPDDAEGRGPNLVRGAVAALHRGAYEVVRGANEDVPDPFFGAGLQVRFVRPNGSRVAVDGFYDGGRTFRARAYYDQVGPWS